MINIISEYKGTMEVSKAFYETFKESCSIDETRPSMNYVYFDGDNQTFIATDGRRMLYHYDNSIGSVFQGFYELAKIGKKYKLVPVDEQGTFPNWQRVIPDMDLMNCITIETEVYNKTTCESLLSLSGNLTKDSWTLCSIIRELDCNLNIEFLTKILKHVDSFEVMKNKEEKNRAIMIIIDTKTNYVIMPMQS